MALTTRKRRPLDRRVEHLRDTRLVIIAAEGRKTERQYFAMFRSTRVQLKVLETEVGNRSAPEHVLARLRQFRDEYQLDEEDALWLMVDVDRWGDRKLSRIAREATANRFGLAISRPCFEVWLLFHFTDKIPSSEKCGDVEAALRQALNGAYNKTKLRPSQFLPHVHAAAKWAQAADLSPQDRWPNKPGTHVYRVIRTLPEDIVE